jgi:hypothetical protein
LKSKSTQASEEKNKISERLKMIQDKLLNGSLQDQNEKHEAEIRRRNMLLEQQSIEQRRLQRELAQREEDKLRTIEKMASLEDEAESLTKKLTKV